MNWRKLTITLHVGMWACRLLRHPGAFTAHYDGASMKVCRCGKRWPMVQGA